MDGRGPAEAVSATFEVHEPATEAVLARVADCGEVGGIKESGYGREGTAETLLEFTRPKNVRFLSGERPVRAWPTVERILA